MMRFDKSDLKRMIFLFIIGFILIGIGFVLVSTIPEKFNDIISETISALKINKSLELKVFYSVVIVGILFLIYTYYGKKKRIFNAKNEGENSFNTSSIVILTVALFVNYAVTSKISAMIIGVLLIIIVSNKVIKNKTKDIVIASILTFYSWYAFFTIINCYIFSLDISNDLIVLLTTITMLFIITIEKKKEILDNYIIITQVFIPIILVNYLLNRYIYHTVEMRLQIPLVGNLLIKFSIILFIIFAVYNLYKKNKKKELLLLTTIISIFIFNCVLVNTSLVLPTDLHHSGENIMGFHQIFNLNQIPYSDYIPVSGLFSVLTGMLMELLGGKYVYYNLCCVLFEAIFATITILLVCRHIGRENGLFFSMMFMLPNYNRVYLILISALILFDKKLINNKNAWLKTWIIVSLIGGLYYPTYGVAVLIGMMPFGIIQFISYIKSKDLAQDIRNYKFYIGWIITLTPVVLLIPLLINMARHILIYSGQTLLADGHSILGEIAPSGIFSNISLSQSNLVRRIMYYSLRGVTPAIIIWVYTIMFIIVYKSKKQIKKVFQSNEFPYITFGLLCALVAYSFTLVRADALLFMSRTAYIITIIGGMFFYIFYKKYIKNTFSSNVIFGLLLGIIMITNNSSLNGLNDKIRYSYNIPNDYIYVEKSNLPRLGIGFVPSGEITTILNKSISYDDMIKLYNNANEILSYDSNVKFTLYGCLGSYYIMDIPTVGQPSIHAIKSIESANELINIIKNEKPVVGTYVANNLQSYYVYHYIITSSDYKYSKKYDAFLPNDLFYKIFGDNAIEDSRESVFVEKIHMYQESSSFGNSYESLKSIFDNKKIEYAISKKSSNESVEEYYLEFDKEINGDFFDYLYLEINLKYNYNDEFDYNNIGYNNKINNNIVVKVSFGAGKDDYVDCILSDGKLLIPLGANSKWLLNNHKKISISIEGIDKNNISDIKEIKFLKLKCDRE